MELRVHFDRFNGSGLQPLAAPFDMRVYQGRGARVHPQGDGLEYSWGVEYRDAAELQRIVGQLPGKPITLLHPDGLISDGVPAHIVGKVRSAELVDGHAVVDFEVSDPAGRAAADAGMHELSLGYWCRADARGFQRDTIVDHLAMVPRARCGPTCEFRPDEADVAGEVTVAQHDVVTMREHTGCGAVQACSCKKHAMSYASLDTQGSAREENMTLEELQKQLEVANKAVEAANSRADQAEKAFKAEKLRADNADVARAEAERAKVASEVTATNAQAALALEKTRADNAEQALKTEKTRADQAEAQASEKARADSAATINARVNERVKLFDAANRVLGSTDEKGTAIDRSAMSDRDIKSKIIEHVDGIDVTKHPSAQGAHGDVFIDGVFEGALARHTASAESRAAVRATIQTGRSDTRAPGSAKPRKDADDSEEAAANNMRRDTSTTWGKSHRRV